MNLCSNSKRTKKEGNENSPNETISTATRESSTTPPKTQNLPLDCSISKQLTMNHRDKMNKPKKQNRVETQEIEITS